MVNEVRIFYNKEKTREVKNPIRFEPVKAGELTKKSLFFFNDIQFPMGLGIQIVGKDIDIKKTITSLNPGEMKEAVFEFSPKLTKMEPIEGTMIIDINYIVK